MRGANLGGGHPLYRKYGGEVCPGRADCLPTSGAITVAEVSAAGRAAIFIPFGAATDAHQMRNAEAMRAAGASRIVPQDQLTPSG